MAKIKITESQLKMIAKHKALNELLGAPESNSKHYTMIWTLKGPTRVKRIEAPDPIAAYKKFMADVRGLLSWKQTIDDLEWDDIELDELNGFKTVRESDLHGVVFYFDGFLSDDEIDDILDIVKKGEPGYRSKKKHNSLNESFGEPKEDIHSIWEKYNESALREFEPHMFSDEFDFADNVISHIAQTAIENGDIDEKDEEELMNDLKDTYGYDLFDMFRNGDDDEPIDYTMGRHDDPNMMPNPPREINLDLNEGQLLLKKVYTKFK